MLGDLIWGAVNYDDFLAQDVSEIPLNFTPYFKGSENEPTIFPPQITSVATNAFSGSTLKNKRFKLEYNGDVVQNLNNISTASPNSRLPNITFYVPSTLYTDYTTAYATQITSWNWTFIAY
jgi:hypothetical protein